MALTLAPETEDLIRSVAVLRGQDPDTALSALLHQALAEAEAIRAELQASQEDFAAGRSMTVEELRGRLRERRRVMEDREDAHGLVAHP